MTAQLRVLHIDLFVQTNTGLRVCFFQKKCCLWSAVIFFFTGGDEKKGEKNLLNLEIGN